MISENSEIYKKMIEDIADLSHKKFRKIYREVNSGSRIKITADEVWIAQRGTNQADLAKLDSSELPSDWKKERWYGAKTALDAVLEGLKSNASFDEKFVEYAADLVHKDWLERNLDRAKDEHKLSYEYLSEEDKEKDRIFVYSAIEICKISFPNIQF